MFCNLEGGEMKKSYVFLVYAAAYTLGLFSIQGSVGTKDPSRLKLADFNETTYYVVDSHGRSVPFLSDLKEPDFYAVNFSPTTQIYLQKLSDSRAAGSSFAQSPDGGIVSFDRRSWTGELDLAGLTNKSNEKVPLEWSINDSLLDISSRAGDHSVLSNGAPKKRKYRFLDSHAILNGFSFDNPSSSRSSSPAASFQPKYGDPGIIVTIPDPEIIDETVPPTPVPAPGAMLLAMAGAAITGLAKGTKTL